MKEIKLEIIRLIRTRIGEISMSMGDYYYLIQKLEELKNEFTSLFFNEQDDDSVDVQGSSNKSI